jgi:hypothetical protein
VPVKTLFEAVAGVPGEPERRLIAGFGICIFEQGDARLLGEDAPERNACSRASRDHNHAGRIYDPRIAKDR